MSFLGLLLLGFIVFFIIIPLIRVGMAVNRVRRQQREMFNNIFGGGTESTSGNSGKNKKENTSPKAKRKKIDANVGEYVEFEEITTTVSDSESTAGGNNKATKTITEQQIVDVEWEDIK